MVGQMSNEIKKRASGLVMNVIGTGLPERIRTTAVAMLGITTAAGLALVLFLYQASWPIPSLGPLTLPQPGQAGIHRGVALGGAGTPTSSPTASALAAAGSAAAPVVVVVPVSSTDTTTATGTPVGDLAGSAPGVDQSQGAIGGSQPGTASPGSQVRQPGATSPDAEEAPAPESAPVATPVTPPTTSPEAPAVPAGEEPPLGGELPELEEPPLEEDEEVAEEPVEEAEDEPAHPGGGLSVVPLAE